MLRVASIRLSNALHHPSPFVDGALQLMKLQLAHRNAAADKNRRACDAIEKEFFREIEAFRPYFTMTASLDVAPQYSKKVYGALRYFGVTDDPLVRQLDLIMGRDGMREASTQGSQMFKVARRASSPQRHSSGNREAAPASLSSGFAHKGDDDPLREPEETTLPEELPNPPQVDLTAERRHGAVRVPLRHRGHWVLQEADIAITRNERREDPW